MKLFEHCGVKWHFCGRFSLQICSIMTGMAALLTEFYFEVLKALVPHILVLTALFLYIAAGAAVFRAIESQNEVGQIERKVDQLRLEYEKLAQLDPNGSPMLCAGIDEYGSFEEELRQKLMKISLLHENNYAPVDAADLITNEPIGTFNPRWSYASAVLYALGVITTSGYSYVQLTTKSGEIFAIAYGLIGLPLLILTAADIGKLMSEMVSLSHGKWKNRKRSPTSPVSSTGLNGLEDPKSTQMRKSSDSIQTKIDMPAGTILAMTLSVCLVGSCMYVIMGWTFIDAFYFTANAVTNVTLGDRPNSGIVFAVVTVLYVVFGLAVVTMSFDLAQSQIRLLFGKIHYFGRKFRFLRYHKKGLDEDVQEVLRIFEKVRESNPRASLVTPGDLLQFINEQILIHERHDPAFLSRTSTELSSIQEKEEIYIPTSPSVKSLKKVESMTTLAGVESIPGDCSISTNSTYYERIRNYNKVDRRTPSWLESGPDRTISCSIGTNTTYYGRYALYRERNDSESDGWNESGPDISVHCTVSTNESQAERLRMFANKRVKSENSWMDSGPDISFSWSISTNSSVYERTRLLENRRSSVAWSESDDFLVDWRPPSPNYSAISKEAKSHRRVQSNPESYKSWEPICKLPESPQEPVGFAMLEDWDSYKEMEEISLLPRDLSVEEEEIVIFTGLSTPLTSLSPSESEFDFDQIPSDSGMSTDETESDEMLLLGGKSAPQPPLFHESLPVYSVERKAVDSAKALASALGCPDTSLSAEIPQMVTDNFCFVLDGNRVKVSDITAGDQFWRPTGHASKYYYSDDLKTFLKVQILLVRGVPTCAKLGKQTPPQRRGSSETVQPPYSPKKENFNVSLRKSITSESFSKSKMINKTTKKPSFADLRRESLAELPAVSHYEDPDEVPLTKVYKVTRYYSFWKTCTGFHRIITVVAPAIGTKSKELKNRIFVQYLWREANDNDKIRISNEVKPDKSAKTVDKPKFQPWKKHSWK